MRLSLSHTHPSLHTHAPGHITPAFIPFYLILSNSSTTLYFFFYSGSSIQSHPPYLIPAVSLMHGLYSSWDFQKYRLSGPESTSQSRKTFRGIVWWEIWIKHDSGAFTCSAVMYSFTMKCRLEIRWLRLHKYNCSDINW